MRDGDGGLRGDEIWELDRGCSEEVEKRGDLLTEDAVQDSHLVPDNAVEIVGKVQQDLSVKVFQATDFGANIGMLSSPHPLTFPRHPLAADPMKLLPHLSTRAGIPLLEFCARLPSSFRFVASPLLHLPPPPCCSPLLSLNYPSPAHLSHSPTNAIGATNRLRGRQRRRRCYSPLQRDILRDQRLRE